MKLKKPFIIILLTGAICISVGFGKNKVQYVNISWNTFKSPHFSVHFSENENVLAQISTTWIEKAYSSLSDKFKYSLRERVPLIIYSTPNLFTQTNIITELLPEEVGGFTELFKNRIAIPFNGSYRDLRHVLHHELVHAFMFGMLLDQFGSSILAGNVQLPLWFMEGCAEYLSSGWDTEADMFMMDEVINSPFTFGSISMEGYMAYKGGQSFLFFLEASRGDSLFREFLQEFKKSKNIEISSKKIYQKSLNELKTEWLSELRRIYWPEIGIRKSPHTDATPLTKHLESQNFYNLRPRLSPDAKKVAFFSDQNNRTEIIISDLNGKILHKISQNGYGGFFESFHPLRSGITWSPDGNQLCFVTKSKGGDELRIVDVNKKKLVKRINTKINSISNPDWSKDGKNIVFCGIDKGYSDLYIYHLQKGTLERLTNSIFYESDPKFSPDGNYLVFTIEDSTGDAEYPSTPYGKSPSELALMNISTKKIKILTSTPFNEKHPCFSPDGNKILFVSDKNGIDNIYIANLDSITSAKPLTNYTGGCSHPDWGLKDDIVVFTLFYKRGWDIWLIKNPLKKIIADTLIPTRWVASFEDTSKYFFKKAPASSDSNTDRGGNLSIEKSEEKKSILSVKKENLDLKDSLLYTNKDSLTQNKKDSLSYIQATIQKDSSIAQKDKKKTSQEEKPISISETQPYRLSFSPDLVSLGVGVSSAYGPAGQVIISLSDLLGDHRITFAGDIQGDITEYAHLYLSYLYLKRRVNMGIGGFYNKDYTYASLFGYRLYHEMDVGGFGILEYPFSIYSRVDLQLLYERIEQKPLTFQGEIERANMLRSFLSFSYDDILWGLTGPLCGTRAIASIQFSPPLKFVTESYLSFDVDYRYYFYIAKKFVWANRIFAGISLPLGKEYSARRYLLGGNDQWIIYNININEYEKNIKNVFYSDFITPFRGWNYVDFSGTRAFVLNSEFRFPFVKEISIVWPLPLKIQYINGAVFADIGNVWDADSTENSLNLPEKLYGGFGFGMRINLGIFVLRFDRGWPTDWINFVGTPINYFSLGAEF
ncbi:MAG: BamA/TamA family outer membrane protein [Chitinispirillaceae bacterium]|nr:BamA/TamA family outer membrane protein [Chitinispirillaceae bacterium]